MRWAVILAGGSGTRFWPLSTPENPKQLLPLAGATSTAEDSVERLAGLIPRDRILVVTGAALASRLQQRLNLPAANILVEARAASTAPALIWATAEAQRRDPEAEVLSLHADWAVGDAAAFRRTAELALVTAREHDRLVTVGVVPSRPETGFGYIELGTDELEPGITTVRAFLEKPDVATATRFVADSRHLWNAGMFFARAARILDDIRNLLPATAAVLDGIAGALAADGPADSITAIACVSTGWAHAERQVVDPVEPDVVEGAERALVAGPSALDELGVARCGHRGLIVTHPVSSSPGPSPLLTPRTVR
jgi:mannose-1-phosphate guanylyltransferase